MSGSVRVKVPATSANLGPGFDAFGLALALYDEVEVAAGGTGLTIEVEGEGADAVPRDDTHLVVQSLHTALDTLGGSADALTLRCVNRIPHGRGLGSSAAAIVAGVLAAFELTGTPPDQAKVLRIAAGIEGHPDNVAACVYGGFTIAWGHGNAVRLDPHPALSAVAFVPPGPLAIGVALGLLPETVPHADAAANAARAALLATAVTTRPDLLPVATEDRLHQPYRAPAMPDSAALVERLREHGVAAVISGAGPTVLALVADQITGLPSAPEGWARLPLAIDPLGAQVWAQSLHSPGMKAR
jgi:homoserine kinase